MISSFPAGEPIREAAIAFWVEPPEILLAITTCRQVA
jgi:hypothetical protein